MSTAPYSWARRRASAWDDLGATPSFSGRRNDEQHATPLCKSIAADVPLKTHWLGLHSPPLLFPVREVGSESGGDWDSHSERNRKVLDCDRMEVCVSQFLIPSHPLQHLRGQSPHRGT